MRRTPGLTLVELVVAIAVVAVLIATGVPMLRRLVLEARMVAAVNALVHAIHLARQEAQKDLRDVAICRSIDHAQCAAAGNWTSGWIVFVNNDRDDPPVVDSGERILHAVDGQALGSITSNRRAYVLRPYALRATNGSVVFCDARGAGDARAVIVSYSGRPRVSRRTAAGGPLTCPG